MLVKRAGKASANGNKKETCLHCRTLSEKYNKKIEEKDF